MKKWIVKDNCLPALMALFLIIFPWITIKSEIGISASEMVLFDNRVTGLLDLFLFGKSIFLIIFAVIFAIILIYIVAKKKEKLPINFVNKQRFLFFAAVFLLLVIVSLILADYKDVAFRGNSNSLEGFLSVISYCIIFIAALVAFSKEENFIYLKISAVVLGLITIVLTLIEVCYEPISKIIIGETWSSNYVNMTSLTFYNTVYFAAFLVMLTSIVFAMFLFEKNIKLSLLSGFVFIGLIFANISTRSTMALYVTIAMLVALVIVKIVILLKKTGEETDTNKKVILFKLLIPVCLVVVAIIINIIGNNAVVEMLFSTGTNKAASLHEDDYYKLCDIDEINGTIVFTGEDSSFVLSVDDDNHIMFDSNDDMGMYMDGDVIRFKGEFESVSAWFEGGYLTIDLGYQDPLYFGIIDDRIVPVRTDGSVVRDMSSNDLGLDGFYNIATGRGYYWVNSLPIIKECIVVGHGQGTFGLYFNQTDYIGSLNTHGTVLSVVDHPHNMYIQVAVQTGVISLIALLVIIIMSLICGVKKVKAICLIENKGFTIGVFTAVIGFLICALTTDSMITVTPIFCALLGFLAGYREQSVSSKKGKKKK